MIEKYQIEAKYVHLEITESAYTDNDKIIFSTIDELRKIGFVVEMDDFGSGYSSLSMFSQINIDYLKLDMYFIKNELENDDDANLVSFIIDFAHKKGIKARRGRAASLNIIPTSTGAASQIGKVIPHLNGKLDGIAFRVPVGDGSVIDVTLELEKNTTVEDVNNMFKSNQSKVLKYTEDPIVSSDIIGEEVGATVDGLLTNIVEEDGKQLLKVVAWYDNEVGYTAQMIRTMKLFM